MSTLPSKLRKNGFDYTQVLREGRKAIYEQRASEICLYYEVFIIRTRPERNLKGKILSAKEVYPSNEDFGKTAWTCLSYEKALEKFNTLD